MPRASFRPIGSYSQQESANQYHIHRCYRDAHGWRTLCFKEHFTQKEHFALLHLAQKNSLLQIALLQFTPQHTLPHGMFSYSEHFAPQPPLPLKTLCSLTPFAARNTLLLNTLCSSSPFTPWNTLLLNTFCSLELFASKHIMLVGIHLTMTWNM